MLAVAWKLPWGMLFAAILGLAVGACAERGGSYDNFNQYVPHGGAGLIDNDANYTLPYGYATDDDHEGDLLQHELYHGY